VIRSFADLDRGFDTTAEAIVVGSGAGGAVAALNLTEAGLETVVIEAGPEVKPEDMTRDAPRFLARYYWEGGMRIIGGSAQIPSLQGRCLGGSTVVNSAIMLRLPDWVRKEWIEEHGLAQLGTEAFDRAYARVFERTRVAPTPMAIMGKRNLIVRDALKSIGLEGGPLPRAVAGCEGNADCITGCATGPKQSVDRSYLKDVSARGAEIFTCSHVERVLIENGRAAGVSGSIVDPRTRRKVAPFVVRAPRIVISAGAAETPALLQRSGITAGGNVGGSFFAHIGAGMVGIMPEVVDPWIGATQGWGAISTEIRGLKFESLWAAPSLIMVRWGDVARPFLEALHETKHAVIMALVYRGKVRGTVRTRLDGSPKMKLYIPDEEVKTVMRGVRLACEGLFNVGARAVYTGIPVLKPSFTSKADLDEIDRVTVRARDLPITANHVFGSCPMSRDLRIGAVETNGQVRGVPGLYVADASLFPTPSAVNPQATIMALSDLVTREIAGLPF
jgi:choline dehydrogenase-like flavoprotein